MSDAKKSPRIQLVSPLESRFGALTGDAKLINGIAEKLEDGTYRVLSRQGSGVFYTLTPPAGQTLKLAVGQFFTENTSGTFPTNISNLLSFVQALDASNDITWYVYFNGLVPVSVNSFTSSAGVTGLSNNSLYAVQYTSKLVAIMGNAVGASSNVGFICVVDINARATIAIGIGPAPNNGFAGGIVVVDNTGYVMQSDGTIFGSALGDLTTWPSTNVIVANNEPGRGIYLTKDENYVIAMKEFSLEFFYDAGNPLGSPLSAVPNTTILWGAVDAGAVQQKGNQIFFLAKERQGAYFVAMLDESIHSSKISTPGVDKIVGDISGPFYSFAFRDSNGHNYFGLTDLSTPFTLVYDIDEKIWYQWIVPGFGYFPYRSVVVGPDGTVYAQGIVASQAASVYQLDEDFVTDSPSGSALFIQVDVYTVDHDFGTRDPKALYNMYFLADQQPGILYSRWSEDDFKTFSNFRSVDLNVKRPQLTKNGSFKRRAWNFRYSSPYRLRLEAVELDMDKGGD